MKTVDPKLDKVMFEMLETGEMEEVLCGDYSSLLNPHQLLVVFEAIYKTTNKLGGVCENILKRFKKEGDRISLEFDKESSLSDEDAEDIRQWIKKLTNLIEVRASMDRKYILFNLVLSVVAIFRPFNKSVQTVESIAQSISIDLKQRYVKRYHFRDVTACIEKFSSIDQHVHSKLLEILGFYFQSVGTEECFTIFLNEAEHLTPEISNMLFNRTVGIFSDEKSSGFLSNLFQAGKNILGYEQNPKARNLSRLYTHSIGGVNLDGLDTAQVVRVATDHSGLSNMMKFFPNLLKLKLLDKEIVQKSNYILDQIDHFSMDLWHSRLKLQTCNMLKNQKQVEKLITIHECLDEIRDSGQALKKSDLKTLIKLRSEELAEFYQAAEDVEKFMTKFDLKNGEVDHILAQFSVDPSTIELRDVCQRREENGPIRLELQQLSVDDLVVLRHHNHLYINSAIFRKIHEQVLEKEER